MLPRPEQLGGGVAQDESADVRRGQPGPFRGNGRVVPVQVVMLAGSCRALLL